MTALPLWPDETLKSSSTEKAMSELASYLSELDSMSPNWAARQELLSSGVTPHTVDALYPESFDLLVPALITHWSEHGFWESWPSMREFGEKARVLDALLVYPSSMREQFGASNPIENPKNPAYQDLTDFLSEHKPENAIGSAPWIGFAQILYATWWMGKRICHFNVRQQVAIQDIAIWTRRKLLPRL